ncbi:hypothetical protein PYW08_011350 [Mythimna loreyi]|uniref:Uncharacterized protein n=1 Tax=Mythimna loreyi TaxID=667449 RepID=A0ACC2Q4Z0_9NEOP|nr:hypothetical protein PYW08_011350 [Mythimna loreyi]
MATKTFLVVCIQALFIQSAFGACTSRAAVEASGLSSPFGLSSPLNPGFNSLACDGLPTPVWSYNELAYPETGCGFYSPAMESTATGGGAFPVSSSSAMSPVGISVQSENMYEGALNAAGELPFVGTAAFESVLATTGSGVVNHACGNGLIAMSALSGTSTPASVATGSPVFSNGLGGSNALAYDRIMAPSFAAPIMAYNASPYADAAWAGRDLVFDGFKHGSSCDAFEIAPTSGGALPVSSASAIPPTGIAVTSENAYEGTLAVGGELPFVGTVAMEGVVPSVGAGAVNHACGNGRTAMISETIGSAGAYAPMGTHGAAATFGPNAFAPRFGPATLGYRGIGRGCGCVH